MSPVIDRGNEVSVPPLVGESHAQAPLLVSEGWQEHGIGEHHRLGKIRWGLVVPLAWATLGILAALQQAAAFAVMGRLQAEWVSVVLQVPRFLLWAPLTPLIVAASRRYPLAHHERRGRHLLLHLGFALLAVSFIESIQTQLYFVAEGVLRTDVAGDRNALVLTVGAILARELSGVFTYFAVAAVVIVMDHKRARETLGARLQADLAQAQVQAIKMQVQPHFLFNTLHAINVLIRQDPATAERMVTRLGDLLRYTLSRATVNEVPLRSELEVLALYLEIERVRFHDRLTVQVDVAPDTVAALVPDLLLQPLAENAIKHGLGGGADLGVVRIRARREADDLVLEVLDSGNGPTTGAPIREGVGLRTVRSRLARLYGERQSFTIERVNGGCAAVVRLPYHEAERV